MRILIVNNPDPDKVRVFGPFDAEQEAVAIGELYSDDGTGLNDVRVLFIEAPEALEKCMASATIA